MCSVLWGGASTTGVLFIFREPRTPRLLVYHSGDPDQKTAAVNEAMDIQLSAREIEPAAGMQDCAGCMCLADELWGTPEQVPAAPAVVGIGIVALEEQESSQSPTYNNSDAEAGTVMIGGEHASITSEAQDEKLRSQRTFVATLFACYLLAMGTIIFVILGCGKAGLYLPNGIVLFAIIGSVDVAVRIKELLEAEQPHNMPDLHRILVKRGAGWLSIGALYGVSLVLRFSTLDPTRAGWQPEAILYAAMGYFCILILAGGMMLQINRDNPANIWRLFILSFGSTLLSDIGKCSPYPLLSIIGTVVFLLSQTVGVYVVVMHLDKKAEPSATKNGYVYLSALGLSSLSYVCLNIASRPLPPLVLSAFLMLFQKVALKVIVPIAKRCWGDDEQAKLWTYIMPTYLLSLELPACLLFLQSSLTNPSFWYLLIFQEGNSVLKNTGYYDQLYLFIRQTVGRPVPDDARDAMEQKRMVLAPCDNIAEVASPVVIVIAVAFSGLFDLFGLDRAAYLAETGLFDGRWQLGHNRSRGEVPIMLLVVLAFRLLFCWIEITLRSFKHRKETTPVDPSTSATDETTAGARKKRRSSMSVLYDRIAHSQNAPMYMKYAAGIWFALGAIIFVVFAASLGHMPRVRPSSLPTPSPTPSPAIGF